LQAAKLFKSLPWRRRSRGIWERRQTDRYRGEKEEQRIGNGERRERIQGDTWNLHACRVCVRCGVAPCLGPQKNGFGYYRSTTGFMAFEPSRCDDRVGELEAVLVYSFSCSFSIDEFRGLKKTKSVGFRRLYGLA
jgi:hypothetical protein